MRHSILIRLSLVTVLGIFSLPKLVVAAEDVKIVAFGASQTNGKGVAESDSYPSQLNNILREQGYSVSVANEGVDGDTTRGMLSRLNRAIPADTKIAIVQPGTNDKQKHISAEETKKNVEEMLEKLKEKKIATVLLGFPGQDGREIAAAHGAAWYGQPNKDVAPEMIQADRQHFTKEGYAVLAKNMSALLIKQKLLSK